MLILMINVMAPVVGYWNAGAKMEVHSEGTRVAYAWLGRGFEYSLNQVYLIIRIMEPFVLIQIIEICSLLLARPLSSETTSPSDVAGKDRKKKFQYSSDSFNCFINSAINIEYVYLILKGV